MMLQGPTPVASNTTRSNICNDDNNSGHLFHQQQHHRHVQAKTVSASSLQAALVDIQGEKKMQNHHHQAKTVPSSSLQAALADIQRKEQRANEKEAESRERDDQHAHTWLVPEERVDDGNNAENRQDSVDAENNDDDADDNDEAREGGSTSSASMAVDDVVVSTTMESREGSHSGQEGSSAASRGRLHGKHASVGSGLLGVAIPSHDDKDTFVTVDDDTTTKSAKETYKDDDDDTTKVGNEDLTLSNPASLDGALSGGALGRCGGDDATKNDADAALSLMRSKSQTLDGANDGKDDDESTTTDIVETSILAKGVNHHTDPSTVANRVRLATDGSSTIVATDNEEEEETVASSAESGTHHRPRHQRRGRGRSHRSQPSEPIFHHDISHKC